MPLSGFLKPWSGAAVRHVPDSPEVNVLDFTYCGLREGRWNHSGEPTLYLSKDEGVAISEYARWFSLERAKLPSGARAVHTFELALSRVLDLRDPSVMAALGLASVADILNEPRMRALSSYLRMVVGIEAVLVPPAAMLDKADAWNLIVYLDKAPGGQAFIKCHQRTGGFSYKPA